MAYVTSATTKGGRNGRTMRTGNQNSVVKRKGGDPVREQMGEHRDQHIALDPHQLKSEARPKEVRDGRMQRKLVKVEPE